MAKMIPEYGGRLDESIKSSAERRVYDVLRTSLPKEYTVLHSVSWIARNSNDFALDGEADFLLVHPLYGILVIEVKGGGIEFDAHSGEWFSSDRSGNKHRIKNPFWQATNAKHQILAALRSHRDWDKLVHGPICIGHAVWLPDISSPNPILGPDRPRELTLTFHDLENADKSVKRAFDYSGALSSARNDIGRYGIEIIESLFARDFTVLPASAARIAEEEQQRIQLTEIQFRLLKMLGPRRRVGIAGGVGTGKTLLAVEKAHDLARRSFKTLLLAYNRPLGDHLASVVDKSLPITATSFHAFCTQLLKQNPGDYLSRAQRDYPNCDYWNVTLPAAICYLLAEKSIEFDAILVDEAQDFADEFWFPLELMLADSEKSPLYLFYDSNQRLYRSASNFPIKPEEEFELTENCRNTAAIHEVVRPLFSGGELNPPAIHGTPVKWHNASTLREQIKAIRSLVENLISIEGLKCEEIVVLIADRSILRTYLEALMEKKLFDGIHFLETAKSIPKTIRALSAAKFKGLEAPVVIVCGLDSLDPNREESRMDLYVAFSRPKNELHLVGNQTALDFLKHVCIPQTDS